MHKEISTCSRKSVSFNGFNLRQTNLGNGKAKNSPTLSISRHLVLPACRIFFFLSSNTRDLTKFESVIAWNISNCLYYKLGGTPWKLASVRDKVCYFGLIYKKLENTVDVKSACCAAQMFLDSGEGLVFKEMLGNGTIQRPMNFTLTR